MTRIYESDIGQWAVEMLERQDHMYLAPEAQEGERSDFRDLLLPHLMSGKLAINT